MNKSSENSPSRNSMSRRDWFRLRRPPQQLADASGTAPVDAPENHAGMDLSELPPLREAMLAESDVLALVKDIASHGEQIQLMVRGKSPATGDAGTILKQAADQLLSNASARLQIRYRWQDALWIDTLQRTDDGIRLVRIQHAN